MRSTTLLSQSDNPRWPSWLPCHVWWDNGSRHERGDYLTDRQGRYIYKAPKPWWRNFLLYVHWPDRAGRWRREAHLQWVTFTHFFGAHLQFGAGDSNRGLQLFFGCGLFAFWFTIEFGWQWMARYAKWEGEREISLDFHDGAVWWNLYTPVDSWSSRTPRWRNGNFFPLDFLLGRPQHSERDLATERVTITLPEAEYPCMVRLFESTWRRKRWPWVWQRMRRAEITPETPIPEPGKGENSWDIEDTATSSMTTPAATAAEAAEDLRASVLRTRKRHGGSEDWRPEPAQAKG